MEEEGRKNMIPRMTQEYVVVVDLPCKIRHIEDLHEDQTLTMEDRPRFPPLDGHRLQKPWEMQRVLIVVVIVL
jgi:hypothetical protein